MTGLEIGVVTVTVTHHVMMMDARVRYLTRKSRRRRISPPGLGASGYRRVFTTGRIHPRRGPLHIPPEVRSPDPGLYPDDLVPFVPGWGLGATWKGQFVLADQIYGPKNRQKFRNIFKSRRKSQNNRVRPQDHNDAQSKLNILVASCFIIEHVLKFLTC